MAITYSPDIGVHGHLTTSAGSDTLQFEPSLTLCTPDIFNMWAGPVSQSIFAELVATTAFQRIAARADSDTSMSIRISVYSVWLEAGEFPSYRPDWHIDRIGGLRKNEGIEYVDLRDTANFPSFLLASVFVPSQGHEAVIHSRSTEFMLASFGGKSGLVWADMREMHRDIDSWLATSEPPPVYKAGNRTIVSFSSRTVHRPGQADVSGWSYLLRLGLYTTLEPCSPYTDHFVFYNPVWHAPTQQARFRRCGSMETGPEPAVRSVPLASKQGAADAASFVAEYGIRVSGSSASTSASLTNAAQLGRQQIGLT
jgi:hypothetical protein